MVLVCGDLKPAFLSSEPGLSPHLASALSLQCYLCCGIQTVNQCRVMPCGEGSKVCYKGSLIVTMKNGEFPVPKAWGWVCGGSWEECECGRGRCLCHLGLRPVPASVPLCTEQPTEASWRRVLGLEGQDGLPSQGMDGQARLGRG